MLEDTSYDEDFVFHHLPCSHFLASAAHPHFCRCSHWRSRHSAQAAVIAAEFLRWHNQYQQAAVRELASVLSPSTPTQMAVLAFVVRAYPQGMGGEDILNRFEGIFDERDLSTSISSLAERDLIVHDHDCQRWLPALDVVPIYSFF